MNRACGAMLRKLELPPARQTARPDRAGTRLGYHDRRTGLTAHLLQLLHGALDRDFGRGAEFVDRAGQRLRDRRQMETWLNVGLGLAFFGVGLANVLLMFRIWGYPYDKARLKSSAPRALVLTHRLLGYLFVLIYLYLMSQMLPRIWH